MEHFFTHTQVKTCTQLHTRVKLLEEMRMKTILKLLVGYIPPFPTGFGTPDCSYVKIYVLYFHITAF